MARRKLGRYYNTLLGYVLLIAFFLGYSAYKLQGGGDAFANAIIGGGLLLVAFAGLFTYPALYKDAIQLREQRARWQPRWALYLGIAAALPIGGYLLFDASGYMGAGFMAGIFGHTLGAALMSTVYLYNRHNRIGVP